MKNKAKNKIKCDAYMSVLCLPGQAPGVFLVTFVEVVCPFLLPRTERGGFGPKAELELLIS